MVLQAIVEAVGLGIWTTLHPCPMATNLAAIAFIGRRAGNTRGVLAAGLLYAAGGAITYVVLSLVLLAGLHAAPLASLLDRYVNQILGPVLMLAAMVLLELLRLPGIGPGVGPQLQGRVQRHGVWAALPLGILLALAFCPVSAACFFVSICRMAELERSWILLPAAYGVGTALPVLFFTVLLALSVRIMANAFHIMTRVQWWIQRIAGTVLLLLGIYFSLTYIFGVTW
ncbi:MAG: aromatic aminobenezylarsenical efflux permease ArsG family transporter [Thermoguttaceae bacterium]